MIDINNLLSKLNEEQIGPVKHTEGPVLVIAGAGSGKTRVLTSRIAYLVAEKKVNPASILAITFTNKAAGEMKERLTKILGGIGDMWVTTIHSMCVKILRKEIAVLGYDSNFTIYDEADKDKVLKTVITGLGYENEKIFKYAKNNISIAKNECLTPSEYKKVYADAYAKYVEIDSPDSDFILSDNYFDMDPGKKTVKILEGTPKTVRLRSVYDIR